MYRTPPPLPRVSEKTLIVHSGIALGCYIRLGAIWGAFCGPGVGARSASTNRARHAR